MRLQSSLFSVRRVTRQQELEEPWQPWTAEPHPKVPWEVTLVALWIKWSSQSWVASTLPLLLFRLLSHSEVVGMIPLKLSHQCLMSQGTTLQKPASCRSKNRIVRFTTCSRERNRKGDPTSILCLKQTWWRSLRLRSALSKRKVMKIALWRKCLPTWSGPRLPL